MNEATQVRDLFNAKAGKWNEKYQPGGALVIRVTIFAEMAVKYLLPNDKILDLGCGTGAIASELAARNFRVTACDIAEQMIEAGRRKYVGSNIEWRVLPPDWNQLPFAVNTYDCLVASSVLEYLPDVAAVLKECSRILKPGGILVATVPNPCKLIRKLERIMRPPAMLMHHLRVVKWIPRLHAHTTYLKCSCNRMSLDRWLAIGRDAGLVPFEHENVQLGALTFIIFRKQTNQGQLNLTQK